MKDKFVLLLFVLAFIYACESTDQKPVYTLWYEQPAQYFEETLVMGNGKMGASIFGGTAIDSLFINDITLWSGEPVNPNMNPDAHQHIPAIRAALENEDYRLADSLNRFIQGSFSQSYAPLGTLYFEYDHDQSAVQSYKRSLNISDASSEVSYQVNETKYSRKYFISHPDQVMAIQLKSEQANLLNFTIRFSSLLKYESTKERNTLKIEGYAPYHAEPNYRGNIENPVRFDKNRGTRFSHYISIKNTDGEVSMSDSSITLSNSSQAEILVSVATSFNGFDKNPAREGKDNRKMAAEQLAKASSQSFDQLLDQHTQDYQSYFDRLSFQLQSQDTLDLPTDQRLKRYFNGNPDQGLEELYFHFGRYLLISSSRTPEVPANLQGLWNPYLRPPWSSNYTVNINVEENYWLAEVANLSELHLPLLSFIENLAKTGKVTAETFYGINRGWVTAHNTDIWAMTNPVGDFGKGHPVWANWNMGGVWLSTHLWEHYAFTQDRNFLSEKAYPLMKGAAEFCLDWMIQDQDGFWITSPSTSPENLYLLENGYRGATLYGATADLAMIRELFAQTIRASKILEIDEAFRDTLSQRLDQMYPYQIGDAGHLQEWYHDWADADPQHRHQSHLFGLYPGHHISPKLTPDLAKACENTLNVKGDKSTGWSQGWRINLWARLKDGNRAHKLYQELLSYVDPSGLKTTYSKGGGTYPNLLDAHPPFQIDGNFGGAAGVLEMLIHSTENSIQLLPAIPDSWSSGQVSGVKARGGFELSFKWENRQVHELKIWSKRDARTNLIFNGKEREVQVKANEEKLVEL